MATTFASSIGITFSSIIFYLITKAVYDVYFHPLAKVPGPFLAKLGCWWKFRAATSLKFADKLRAAHDKYGPVVRIACNEVSVISPEDVKSIYGHKSDYMKGQWYEAWKVGPLQSHFSERNGKAHGERRRLTAAAFSVNHLRTLERAVDENVEVLCRKYLDVAAEDENKTPVDLSRYMEWFCYDSVAQMSWGKTYGLLQNGGDHTGLIHDLGEGTILVSCMAITPLGWMLSTDVAQKILGYLQPDKGICGFMKQATKIVTDRLELKKRDPIEYEHTKDMLYRFIDCLDPAAMSEKHHFDLIVNEVAVVVVAGADTTLVSTNASLRYIYGNSQVLATLRAEISEAIELGKLSLPNPPYDQVAALPYLNACIKEATRLHPAVGMPLQRIVPQPSASADGARGKVIAGKYYLPPGTSIGMSAWNLHQSKEAFGEDAAEFRPERWLGPDRNELEKYNLSFGMGARVCLGKNISMMEMNKLIPTIIHNYDIEFVNKVEPYRTTQCWFTIQRDFMVKINKRADLDH